MPWNCLMQRKALVASFTVPAWEWSFSFPLPTDFITLVELNGDVTQGDPGDWWDIEAGNLLTDDSTANIKYVGFSRFDEALTHGGSTDPITNIVASNFTASWSAEFEECFVLMFASKLSPKLRQDGRNMAERLLEQLKLTLSSLGAKDANQRRVPQRSMFEESQFLNARFFGPNG
jgi:hypothetical protein